MAKTVVVFRSEYGSTKRYAAYIAEKLQADLFSTEEAKEISLYDTIIFGGGIYAGALNGADWLKKNQETLSHKKLILFTCGLSNPQEPKNLESIHAGLQKCLTEELFHHAQIFSFQGALDYKKLKFTHKGIMTVVFQALKHKKERSAEEDVMLKSREMAVDFVDVSKTEDLISLVKE
ncbi:MAG: flavodoxin domain-containing protein [Anaerotignum sp.]|nr:flavodoxin domain-containing protein [Anaerotignum sp.]